MSNINDGPVNPSANEILFANKERQQLFEVTFKNYVITFSKPNLNY